MKCKTILVALWVGLTVSAGAMEPLASAQDPVHNELRTLRAEVIAAIEQQDIDRVLAYLHPDVVITWQNGEVCRGHDGVREFFERMGKYAFRGYKEPPTPAELTILHGDDAGVSYGKAVGQFQLFGKEYTFENHWTATLVKQDGNWLLASYHVSWNALDNPLLTACKRAIYVAAPLAFLVGMILGGYVIKRKLRGKRMNDG